MSAAKYVGSPFERMITPVLVVPEVGRAEPQRAVLLEHVAVLAEPLDPAVRPSRRSWIDVSRGPDVEVHPEPLEAGLDPFADPRARPAADGEGRVRLVRRRVRPHVVRRRRAARSST